ncbi:MAG: M20/M25/M40 family metallo-hydrolase, partial [Candidatus Bathyarchaeia archaeon]
MDQSMDRRSDVSDLENSLNKQKERILDLVEYYKKDIIDFAMELIKYKSVRGEECRIQKELLYPFIKSELSPHYVEIYSEDKELNRPNIVALWKGDGKRSLLLNGHVDVVDVTESELKRWNTDPWNPIIVDGKIFGRGAADMKGGITSMLWALKILQEAEIELKGPIGLELVVGEELGEQEIGTISATKKLLERTPKFDFCIDPEPTNCEIHTLSRGVFDFEIEVEGREIHSATRNLMLFPQRWGLPCGNEVGADAISKIIDIINALRKLEIDFSLSQRHPILGGGGYPQFGDAQGLGSALTINISILQAGEYLASVPGKAHLIGQCYYPPWISFEEVKKLIYEYINAQSITDSYLRKNPPKVYFARRYHWPPYNTNPEHEGCKMLGRSFKDALKR